MPEHLLNRAQVGSAFEQVGGERVTQQVRVHAPGIEPGFRRQLAQDEEGARAGEGATLGVQEELGPVTAVEVWASARQVPAKRLGRMTADRDDAFLVALADHADEPVVEVDARLVEPDGLRDAQACAVEQLDERLIAKRAGLSARGRVDQTLRLAWRERLRQVPGAARELHRGRRVVVAGAEQLLVAEEAAGRGGTTRDRRGCEPVGSELGGVVLELFERRGGGRMAEECGELRKVVPVRVDCARRPSRSKQSQKAVDVCVAGHPVEFGSNRPEPPGLRARVNLVAAA